MEQPNTEGKNFDNIDFKIKALPKGDYDDCRFITCDFYSSDLSERRFIDCEFIDCNLSLVKILKTTFRDAKFKNCKMLGLNFNTCDEFGLSFSFEGCLLNHSSLYKTNIKKTVFLNSQIQEVDFTECDLTASVFNNCDLLRATFDNTVLEKADFRTSYNYSIDPETNRIKNAKFSLPGVLGLLTKYDIEIES